MLTPFSSIVNERVYSYLPEMVFSWPTTEAGIVPATFTWALFPRMSMAAPGVRMRPDVKNVPSAVAPLTAWTGQLRHASSRS